MKLKIWKYPLDVIQCVRSSYYIDNLFIIYLFLKRNSILNIITREHLIFLVAYLVTSSLVNIISLVLNDSDTDSF